MKVQIDEEKCVAAGQCAAIAPDVFDQRDEDGVVILLNADPSEDEQDDVRRAASACPALAIALEG